MNDRLYRTVDDRVLAGVCGGLAVRMGLDPSLVRIGYAIVALVTGIFPLLVLYVVMVVVVPEEPTGFAGVGRSPTPPGPDAVPGWTPPGGSMGWPVAGTAGRVATPVHNELAADATAAAGEATLGGAQDATPPPPVTPQPGWPPPAGWSRHERRERRRGDPLPAVIGGLVLVGLGAYFLLRDQLAIDWDIVWPAGLVALGAVVLLAAFRPRR